jgi:excisionase family DNA binding protein
MKLMTIHELSEMLQVKTKTLYQWAELGQIPCIKLNGALRFDLDDILSWIRSCKKEPDSGYNPFVSHQARSPQRRCD